MKYFIVCIFLALGLSACNIQDLPAQWESERYLKATLIAPSTYKKVSFSKIKEVTIKDDLDERYEALQRSLELSRIQAESYFATEADRQNFQEEKERLAAVDGLYELYEGKLDSVARYEYRLVYEASNQYGVPVRGTFDTRFTTSGYIVGARMGDDSWTILGNFFSVPEYYDIILKKE